MGKVSKELLALMDGFRDYKFDFSKFIQAAKTNNIHVDYSSLRELSRSYPEIEPYLFPEILSDLIQSLLSDFHPKKIYNPRTKNGSLLSNLVEYFKPQEGALGTLHKQADAEIIKYLTADQKIIWQPQSEDFVSEFLSPLATTEDQSLIEIHVVSEIVRIYEDLIKNQEAFFDLIVWTPHLDLRDKWYENNTWSSQELADEEFEENLVEMFDLFIEKDQEINEIITTFISDVVDHSPTSKIGIFTVSPDFFNEVTEDDLEKKEDLDRWRKIYRDELEESDCYIDAAIQIPYQVVNSIGSIPLYLILTRNGKSARKNKKMFVGQLSGDRNQDSILLKNYRERKPGRIPQQGFLIDEGEFTGLDVLINEYETKQMAARSGFIAHALPQIAKKITFLINQRVNNSFAKSYNCIYVLLKDDHAIVTTENEFSLNPWEYAQFVIKGTRYFSLNYLTTNGNYTNEKLKKIDWNLIQRSETTLPVPLDTEAVEVNFHGKQDFYDIFSEENCIYMPISGNSPVVTSADEFVLNQGKYVQIILDSEKVFAPYLAKLLNTQLGLKIRQSFITGLKVPKITKASLEAGTIYLPDIEVQREAIRVNTEITNFSSELNILQRQLLDLPKDAKIIEGKLRKISQEKGWEIWMEDLPFPMASILWAYLSTVDPKDKLEHISHFFEASIQFLATICLSALAQDKEYYQANQKEWNTENSKYKGWYKNASFGGWYSLHAPLAKFIRRLMMQENTKTRCLNLFGNPNDQFIYGVTSKKLLSVFETANKYRNMWIGHRGRLSEKEAETRTLAFEDLLTQMRDVIGDSFSQISLLSPKTNEYVDGLFEYTVKVLKGTRTEFKEVLVKTKTPMDKNKLYLLSDLQLTPMRVLPFGKLMSSPKTEQNAFYFYSRFDNDGVRWVSYHFEKEAEINQPDSEFVGLMKELFDGASDA